MREKRAKMRTALLDVWDLYDEKRTDPGESGSVLSRFPAQWSINSSSEVRTTIREDKNEKEERRHGTTGSGHDFPLSGPEAEAHECNVSDDESIFVECCGVF